MKKLLSLSLLALISAPFLRAEPSRADLVARVETCEAILEEFQHKPSTKPSAEAWKRAKAVLIVNQFKAGFLLGVQDGFGVIMVKKPDGLWSLPVLVNQGTLRARTISDNGSSSCARRYSARDSSTRHRSFSRLP